jgi:hypothetical protein
MVTLLEILFSPFTLGVYYQWHWYTLVATLALLVVGYLVSRFVLRKIGAKSRD